MENNKTRKNGGIKIQKLMTEENLLFVIASIIGLLNVYFLNDEILSLTMICMEIGILLYLFLKNDITRYLGYYLIFLCLSFEFSSFIGTEEFYGFKNFRIFGINLGLICLVPIVVKLIFRGFKFYKLKKYTNSSKFCYLIVTMNFFGVIMGLIGLLADDNNIQNIPNFFSVFIGRCYEVVLFPILVLLSFSYVLLYEKSKLLLLKDFLMGILIGGVVAMVSSLLSGNFGTYGGVDTLLAPMITWFSPFILFMIFTNTITKSKGICLIAGIIGTALLLIYNASGKLFIMLFLFPILIVISLLKQKRIVVLISLLLAALPIGGIIFIFGDFTDEMTLFNSKLTQVIALLKVWESDWLYNLPESPRFRIGEFLNICYEYIEKPWYFLLGKGYLGSVQDHVGVFSYIEGAFSDEQWSNGSFYNLHATINTLFLSNGILGVGVYIYYIKQAYTKMLKPQWGIVGAYWFLVLYGYSITITAFGLVCLLIVFYEIDDQMLIKETTNECYC